MLPSEELLITAESGKSFEYDVFEKTVKGAFQCFASPQLSTVTPSITGDGKYIVGNAASDGRSVVVHEGPQIDFDAGDKKSVLWKSTMHPSPITAIAASPISELVVTGCDKSTVFWQPDGIAKKFVKVIIKYDNGV